MVIVSALVGGALVRDSAGRFAPSPSQTGSNPGSGPVEPSAGTQGTFPIAAETKLLGLIPPPVRDLCLRADPANRPLIFVSRVAGPLGPPVREFSVVDAGIECNLGGIAAPDQVWLREVRKDEPAAGDNAAGALSAHAGLAGATPGSCREARPALETWSFGTSSGKLVCYESEKATPVLLWVYDGSQVFGRALRDDKDMAALLDWWEQVARFAAP